MLFNVFYIFAIECMREALQIKHLFRDTLTMFQKEDNFRTVGIYTDYIDTTDFELKDEDKEFARRVIKKLSFLSL